MFDDIQLDELIRKVKENNVEITLRITAEGEQEVEIQPHTYSWTTTTTPCAIVDESRK